MSSSVTSMYGQLGPVGLLGIFLMTAGLAVIAWFYWEVAVGLALVLAGIGLIVRAMIQSVMRSFGMMPQ